MSRIWLISVAVAALVGTASMAQAAPASPVLGGVKAANTELAGTAEQAHWRYRHYRRHHHHHHRWRHHHRRHHHHHRGW